MHDPTAGGSPPAVWATGVDRDPRLVLRLDVGPMTAVAFADPWLAVARGAQLLAGSGEKLRELPCDEPVRCLAFATLAGEPHLVSGHRGGRLRLWRIADSSVRETVETGPHDVVQLHLTETGVVTRDAQCSVQCWSLPSLEPIGVPRTAFSVSGGRHVLLLAGDDGLTLDNGALSLLTELTRLRSVTLSVVDGRDCATVMDDSHLIATLDLATGALVAPPIKAHRNVRPDGLRKVAGLHPPLAVLANTLAVPTPWRVHLWDLRTSQELVPPLTGPVARSLVQTVTWQDRELLLTASPHDGVVALWDLARPVSRPPGHGQPICAVTVVDEIVVSADEGGTIVARHTADGALLTEPLRTGVESTRALAAWRHGDRIVAAQGAGSRYLSDGRLRLWDLVSLEPSTIDTKHPYVHWLSLVGDTLVTYAPPGMLKVWHRHDGTLLAETDTGIRSKLTGFTTGMAAGTGFAALSSTAGPLLVYTLDDLTVTLSQTGTATVLAASGPHLVTTDGVWHLSGARVGPALPEIVLAAPHTWPAAFLARADGTISLADLETGADLCPPVHLPTAPRAMTVTPDGDLIVAYGSDLARLHPPTT